MFITVSLPKAEKKGIPISEYFAAKKQKAAPVVLIALPLMAIPAVTEAAINQDAVIRAFDPLIDLAQSLSYPLTFLVMVCGMLFIIIGQKTRGLQMIKYAVVGFIGVQFVPGLMRILMQVGQAMRAAQQ